MKMLEMKNVNFRPWPKFRNWEKQSFGHGRRIEFSVNLHFGHGRNVVFTVFHPSAMAESQFSAFFVRRPRLKTNFRRFLGFIHG